MYSIFTNVYLKDNNKLRLLHRAADKAIWPDALLGIGGKVEPDEDLFAAAKREFLEEAGVELLDLKLVGTLSWLDDSNQNGINYIFVATKYKGTLVEACDEGTFEWVDIEEALVSPRTAVHQLKYLPYLMNGQHFSQHLIFQGLFSEGKIIKDYNSVDYTNHRLSKQAEQAKVNTSNEEKLAFLTSIIQPYDIPVTYDPAGITVDVTIFANDPKLNKLFETGIKKSVEDGGIEFNPDNAIRYYQDKIAGDTNIVLQYSVNGSPNIVYIPARLTKTPKYTDSIKGNFFWSFVQFDIDGQWIYYTDLRPQEKQTIFSLLAQAVLSI